MLKNLFLSTLFAATFVSGAALAEKPGRAIDRVRAHGDVVDKIHRSDRQTARPGSHDLAVRASFTPDRGRSRVSCSDSSLDCAAQRSAASRSRAESGAGVGVGTGEASRDVRAPAALSKALGSERTSFNEAGEANAMSARAASRVWSRGNAAVGGAGLDVGAAAAPPAGQQQKQVRVEKQAAANNRVACNDAGECMASSKASRKEWSYQAVKAGTWRGPEAQQPTNAERVIAAMKSQKAAPPKP